MMMSKFNTKGLTLIECVIAILILAVTVTGGLMIYTHASTIMSKAMHKKMTLEIAIQAMEEIKNTEFTNLTLTTPPDGWDYLSDKTIGALTTQPHTTQLRRRITEVTVNSPKMKKVELEVKGGVEVAWTNDNSDSRIVKLQTFISPP